jgi:activator of HSP90 ATPase
MERIAMDSFKLTATFGVSPAKLYSAWLNAEKHADMIDADAVIRPIVGSSFNMWNKYITGTIEGLFPKYKIVQRWRTADFPPDAPDSILELLFDDYKGGTRLTLIHSQIPKGQGRLYKQGWIENYFEPIKGYFD